jgi:hypothetical protein
MTALNTVTVQADIRIGSGLKLLIDTGAEKCLLKYTSIEDGTVYNPKKALHVRSISNGIEKTLGETNVKLTVGNYETEHKFQVIGDGANIPCDGILGQDFFESKGATIEYIRKEIVMGELRLKFDHNTPAEEQNKEIRFTLKPRCETVIRIPTIMEGPKTVLLEKTEIAPGVIVARALTVVREGSCISTVVNMNEEMVNIALPTIRLQDVTLKSPKNRTSPEGDDVTRQITRTKNSYQDRSHER